MHFTSVGPVSHLSVLCLLASFFSAGLYQHKTDIESDIFQYVGRYCGQYFIVLWAPVYSTTSNSLRTS